MGGVKEVGKKVMHVIFLFFKYIKGGPFSRLNVPLTYSGIFEVFILETILQVTPVKPT